MIIHVSLYAIKIGNESWNQRNDVTFRLTLENSVTAKNGAQMSGFALKRDCASKL